MTPDPDPDTGTGTGTEPHDTMAPTDELADDTLDGVAGGRQQPPITPY